MDDKIVTDAELDEIARQFKRAPLSKDALDKVQADLDKLHDELRTSTKRDAYNVGWGVLIGLTVGIMFGAKLFS